jgi:hypothetical protein
MAIAALHGLRETMHAAFGQACPLGEVAYALAAVLTKTFENLKTFVPKSHVGLCSEGCLNSSPEFSPSAYLTDTSLSRLKRILNNGYPLKAGQL